MRRHLSVLALAAALLGVPAATASAGTLYAAPYTLLHGSATLPCTQAVPCNLRFAIQSAGEGDDVAVLPGSYRQPVISELVKPPPFTETLDVTDGVTVHPADPSAPAPVVFVQLTSVNDVGIQVRSGGLLDGIAVESTATAGATGSAAVRGLPASRLDHLRVVAKGAAGTTTAACETGGFTLLNSVCVGAGAEGRVDAVGVGFPAVTAFAVRNVTAITTTPGGLGLRFGTGDTATLTASNVIARGVVADVALGAGGSNGDATLAIDHSNWATQQILIGLGSHAHFTQGPGNQTGATAATPLFVNAAANDYRQAAGSPTIDAGVTSPLNGATALGGAPRALGASTDIGADEFVPPPPPTGGAGGGGTGGSGGGGAAGAADTVAPLLGGLALGRTLAAGTTTTIRFTLSEPGRVTLLVARRLPGRRVGKACRAPRKANATRPRCVRLKIVRRLTVDGTAGANAVTLTGRLPGGTRLRPGAYVLIARITDAAGNVGVQRTARFVLTK